MQKLLGWLLSLILIAVIAIIGYGLFVDSRPAPIVETPAMDTPPQEEIGNIVLTSPSDGDTVASPLVISGRARTFEASVSWRVLAPDDELLLEGFFTYASPEVGEYGDFEERIFLPVMDSDAFALELYTESAMDGSPQDVVRRSLTLADQGASSVEVYFADEAMAEFGDCAAVDFEKRTVSKTINVAELAILELLKGPTAAWASTLIPEGTALESIEITDGVAHVQFTHPNIVEWNGGACRVTAIRAQIERTLKQFSTVDSVVISVNGETDEILQP